MSERPDIRERKAIARYLTVRAARALVRRSDLPWWSWWQAKKIEWSATQLAVAAEEIERGLHLDEQSSWIALLTGDALRIIHLGATFPQPNERNA